MDDPNLSVKKNGGNSNKEGIAATTNDSAGGSSSATQTTGCENDTVALPSVKKIPAVGAKTGKIFSQRIYCNDNFEYSSFGG